MAGILIADASGAPGGSVPIQRSLAPLHRHSGGTPTATLTTNGRRPMPQYMLIMRTTEEALVTDGPYGEKA